MFMEQIDKLNKAGKTIILITHDMGLVAEHAERTIIMQDGQIVMDDLTREVFARQDIRYKLSIEPHLLTRISNDIRKTNAEFPVILTIEELQRSLTIDVS